MSARQVYCKEQTISGNKTDTFPTFEFDLGCQLAKMCNFNLPIGAKEGNKNYIEIVRLINILFVCPLLVRP